MWHQSEHIQKNIHPIAWLVAHGRPLVEFLTLDAIWVNLYVITRELNLLGQYNFGFQIVELKFDLLKTHKNGQI